MDTNALAYSGRAPDPARQAALVRRWGWWYQAELRLWSMKAYWSSIIGTALLTPLLYVVAMGIGLGSLVDATSGGIDGVPYLVFVAPGLLVSTVVMSATNETSYPVMAGFKWGRQYFARATTAASPAQVAIGELLAVGLRLLGEALVFWLVLVVMGAVEPTWSWLMVPVAALAGMAFGTPLAAYAATLEDEGPEFASIQRFVVMPMFLFAGTFYPLTTMPIYLQWIGWISPMWHGTQLARLFGFGLPLGGWEIVGHLAFLLALVGLGGWLAVRNFGRRLAR
ncbi:MAG: ABC transporter permease [Actinobacteria bacterium]|nr:ABC transporter permease [Actinomycetota bacterium]